MTGVKNVGSIYTGKRFGSKIVWGTRWGRWLRHGVASPKVAGSIPDGAIGIFH
jgi:hypothetical protein